MILPLLAISISHSKYRSFLTRELEASIHSLLCHFERFALFSNILGHFQQRTLHKDFVQLAFLYSCTDQMLPADFIHSAILLQVSI